MKAIHIFKSTGARLIALMISFTLVSCDPDETTVIPVVPSYADPQRELEAFEDQLLSAEHGWEGTLSPQPGKMYHVFLQLDDNGKVFLYTDADSVAAKTATQTDYEIRLSQGVNPSLLFQAGSNLDRIPGPQGNKGVDKEYSFKYVKGDTIQLLGNQYGDALTLVKATQANQDRYETMKLRNSMNSISRYLRTVRFLYLQPEPGKVIQFALNPVSRSVYAIYNGEELDFSGSDYSYSLDGIMFRNTVNEDAFALQELLWDETVKKLYTVYNGTRLYLQSSPMPVIPLHMLLGNEYSSAAVFPSPNLETLPGWSLKFQSLWLIDDQHLWDEYRIALYYIVPLLQMEEKRMSLWVFVINPAGIPARAKFSYEFDKTEDGVFTFSPLPFENSQVGQNAATIADDMPNILGVINNNRFRIEFYDAFKELGALIPQYKSVDDPNLYFTGYFYSE